MPKSQSLPVDLNPAATEDTEALNNANDPFADDQFAPLDTRTGPDFSRDLTTIADEHPELMAPEQPQAAVEPPPQAAAEPVAAERVPEVITYDDGSSITIEKTNKGWHAVLDSGQGGTENFYGKTKDEMWTNVASAKLHATRKIRDLNKKLKLGTGTGGPVVPDATTQAPVTKQLTAEEIFEIKNLIQSDPTLAFDKYIQKKTGMTAEQLGEHARSGETARKDLAMEAVVREFLTIHPNYDPTPGTGNFENMISWLMKYKMGQPLNGRDPNEVNPIALYDRGVWTLANLEEAFEDLSDAGLLQLISDEEVDEPQAPPAPTPAPTATQPAPNPRIARVRVGPRAGLGIRASEATQARQPDATRPPSADEFENLSDEEIVKHFNDVRRFAATQARR